MNEWIPLIVSVLTSGGLVGAIVALVKLRPEAGLLVVKTAEGAVLVQSKVIDDLQENNRDKDRQIIALREEVKNLREEVRTLRQQVNGMPG